MREKRERSSRERERATGVRERRIIYEWKETEIELAKDKAEWKWKDTLHVQKEEDGDERKEITNWKKTCDKRKGGKEIAREREEDRNRERNGE